LKSNYEICLNRKESVKLSYNSEEIDALLKIAPLLNEFMLEDIGILITDTEKVLAYYPGERLDFGIKVGEAIDKNWVVDEALKQRRRVVNEVDESVCGVPYIGVGNPIFNENGTLVGGITISQPTEKKERLLAMSKDLLSTTEEVNNQVEEIAIEAEDMVEMGEKLEEISDETEARVRNTDNIVEIIKDIADKIKILGINASIEAARVGEEGQGFAVVAKEVQNLAEKSVESTTNIEETLEKVNEISSELNNVSEKLAEASDLQASVVNKIHAEMQSLNVLGNKILEMAESLSDDG